MRRLREQVGRVHEQCAVCGDKQEFTIVESWTPLRRLDVVPVRGDGWRRRTCRGCGFSVHM